MRTSSATDVEKRRKKTKLTIRLTPYAWAKLVYLRDLGTTEIGGFGISAEGDSLLIEDVRLVRQRCDVVTVEFDDEAVADFFDEQVDAGRRPDQFARVWVHTHPGDSPRPSLTDEATFARVFGGCQWAVMLILARGGQTYARLQFGVGPGGSFEVPVEVDYAAAFEASDQAAWQREYDACVEPIVRPRPGVDLFDYSLGGERLSEEFEWLDESLAAADWQEDAYGE